MPHHPADGPRLKTLYVSQSTRKRRRRTTSKRKRRNVLLAVMGGVALVVSIVAFQDKIGKRIGKMITKSHPPAQMVRDVTAPNQPVAPDLKQAGTTVSHAAPRP